MRAFLAPAAAAPLPELDASGAGGLSGVGGGTDGGALKKFISRPYPASGNLGSTPSKWPKPREAVAASSREADDVDCGAAGFVPADAARFRSPRRRGQLRRVFPDHLLTATATGRSPRAKNCLRRRSRHQSISFDHSARRFRVARHFCRRIFAAARRRRVAAGIAVLRRQTFGLRDFRPRAARGKRRKHGPDRNVRTC